MQHLPHIQRHTLIYTICVVQHKQQLLQICSTALEKPKLDNLPITANHMPNPFYSNNTDVWPSEWLGYSTMNPYVDFDTRPLSVSKEKRSGNAEWQDVMYVTIDLWLMWRTTKPLGYSGPLEFKRLNVTQHRPSADYRREVTVTSRYFWYFVPNLNEKSLLLQGQRINKVKPAIMEMYPRYPNVFIQGRAFMLSVAWLREAAPQFVYWVATFVQQATVEKLLAYSTHYYRCSSEANRGKSQHDLNQRLANDRISRALRLAFLIISQTGE